MRQLTITAVLFCLSLPAFSQEVLRIRNGAVLSLLNNVDITINGGVALEDGSTLLNNGSFRIGMDASSGKGDFVDSTATAYQYGSGTFLFAGGANQSIYCLNGLARIDVNTGSLDLNSDISAGKWHLTNGLINTGNHSAIVSGTAATDLEADQANINFTHSWINGKLRRYVSPATVDNYPFALGNSGNSNIAEMDSLTANPLLGVTYIDAAFTPKPGTDAGLLVSEGGVPYVVVNNGGVWLLTPDALPSGGSFNLKLFFTGFTGLADNAFAILHRPDASSNAADWSVPSGSNLNPNDGVGRKVSDGFALRKSINGFSQFGIGQSSTPLPVNLLLFQAIRLNRTSVALSWKTDTEQNNKGFFIERRLKSEMLFSSIGFVPTQAPGGNSKSELAYRFTDANGYGDITYYRIKQTDLDDHSYYSMIIAVQGSGETVVSVLLWPNPSRGQFSVRMDGITGTRAAFIFDMNGRAISKLLLTDRGQVDVSALAAGTYVLRILDAFGTGEDFEEKIAVMR